MDKPDWKTVIHAWRSLPAEEKQAIRWRRIPRNVALSMAFEGEPVDLAELEAEHARKIKPSAAVTSECLSVGQNIDFLEEKMVNNHNKENNT